MAFESNIVRTIKRRLKRARGPKIKFIKIHGDALMEEGTPDIIGCYRSICFVLECKNARGRLRPMQKVRLRQWKRAGAVTGVPRSGDDAVRMVIERIDNALGS